MNEYDPISCNQNQPFVEVMSGNQYTIMDNKVNNEYNNGENYMEDEGELHQTFDEFLVLVNLLMDDEDDQLQKARDKVRQFRKKTKVKVVVNDVGEQIPIEVVN